MSYRKEKDFTVNLKNFKIRKNGGFCKVQISNREMKKIVEQLAYAIAVEKYGPQVVNFNTTLVTIVNGNVTVEMKGKK